MKNMVRCICKRKNFRFCEVTEMKEQRFYNFDAFYNKIAFSDITQEYVRILRYIPENRLVCADSIIPCEIWKTPKDYFDKKEPVKLPVPWPDIHCRKLFAEVDFSEIKEQGFDKYIIYHPVGLANLQLYNYDVYNSNAEIEALENALFFHFHGAYNKNGKFDIIEDHIFVPELTVRYENVTALGLVISSCTERVKKGAGIFPKETHIDVSDKEKTADFLSSLKTMEPYFVSRSGDNTQMFIFILPSGDRLEINFSYGRMEVTENNA